MDQSLQHIQEHLVFRRRSVGSNFLGKFQNSDQIPIDYRVPQYL